MGDYIINTCQIAIAIVSRSLERLKLLSKNVLINFTGITVEIKLEINATIAKEQIEGN